MENKIKKFKPGMQFIYTTNYGGELLLTVHSTECIKGFYYVVTKAFNATKQNKNSFSEFSSEYNKYEVENCIILDRKYKLERILDEEKD